MLRRTLLAALTLLAACASHQKAGDRAGAVGDWKTAEREYAQALRDDPDSTDLRAKHRSAREQALSGAVGRARACAAGEDWECAYAEADYAAALDGANAELALFRRDAARSLGLARVRKAEDASRQREYGLGLELLAQARAVTDDAGVASQGQRLQPALVRGAVDSAEKLRAAGQLPQAIELLARAAEADGSVRPRLEALRAEHGRQLDAEYESRTAQGDALLAQGRYGDAQLAYEAALQARQGGRAAPLARYAAEMSSAQAAAQARQWDRAAKRYQAAVKTGVADGGQAAQELARVRMRPYALQLRSVLVRPSRPDGRPWVGERSRVFDAVMIAGQSISAARVGSGDGAALKMALDVANACPPRTARPWSRGWTRLACRGSRRRRAAGCTRCSTGASPSSRTTTTSGRSPSASCTTTASPSTTWASYRSRSASWSRAGAWSPRTARCCASSSRSHPRMRRRGRRPASAPRRR